ncbi:MAG: hypothetical protein II844_01775 [Prevotella sp.]|nr:hypothetical protein [Prevotella sp.]
MITETNTIKEAATMTQQSRRKRWIVMLQNTSLRSIAVVVLFLGFAANAAAQEYITGIYTKISGPQTLSLCPLKNMFSSNDSEYTCINWSEVSDMTVPRIDITFQTSEPVCPTGYLLARHHVSGFEYHSPVNWELDAKANEDDEWVFLANENTDVLKTEVSKEFSVYNNKHKYYKYFRLRFFKPNSQEKLAIREFKFRGYKAYDLSQSDISGVRGEYMYKNGNDIVPTPSAWLFDDYIHVELVKGIHYTTTIMNAQGDTVSAATALGNYTIALTGISPNTGSKSAGFNVVKYWQGDGTEQSPYIIANEADFNKLAAEANNNGETYAGTHFRLDNDLTYGYDGLAEGESNFTPIGMFSGYRFSGVFDGNDHTISGIRICRDGDVGIFAENRGTIKNLTVTDTRIEGNYCVGGIAGSSSGTIDNCHVTSTVTLCANSERVGGITGSFSGSGNSISRCTSAATIVATGTTVEDCGGIVGEYSNGTVSNCISTATITAATGTTVKNCGGIVGKYSYGGTLTDNFAVGVNIPATEDNTHGAIIGFSDYYPCRNYYMNCTVGGVENATNVGAGGGDINGARYALPFNYTDKLTLTNTSRNTSIKDTDNGGTYNGQFYIGATEKVAFKIKEGTNWKYYNYSSDNGTFDLPSYSTNIPITTKYYRFTVSADAIGAVTINDSDVLNVDNGADGSEENPFIITTTEGLDFLGFLSWHYGVTGMYFKLGNDIAFNPNDLTIDNDGDGEGDSNYTPINDGNGHGSFEGIFDGCGHTISGIRIYKPNASVLGLFGWASGGTVKNLTLDDTNIVGSSDLGGIAAFMRDGSITNCHVTSSVTIQGSGRYVGGIVGRFNSNGEDYKISHCTSSATLVLTDVDFSYYGGIAGTIGKSKNSEIGGTLSHNLAYRVNISGNSDLQIAAITGGRSNDATLDHNYYADCNIVIDGVLRTADVGYSIYDKSTLSYCYYDFTDNDGAVPAFALHDKGTANAAIVAANTGAGKNVALYGRKLYKDGMWNTICLPFSVDLTDEDSPLHGATARTLSNAYVEDGTLHLSFGDAVTELAAGVPYIIKWTKPDGYDLAPYEYDIYCPVFSNMTVSSETPVPVTSQNGTVSFVGTYNTVNLAANDKSSLYLGSANKLLWPDENVTLGVCRAYFKINGGAAAAKGITNMVIDFGEDEVATGINEAAADSSLFTPHSSLSGWHTVSGIRLSGKPSKKGMYIHNGNTVVVE